MQAEPQVPPLQGRRLYEQLPDGTVGGCSFTLAAAAWHVIRLLGTGILLARAVPHQRSGMMHALSAPLVHFRPPCPADIKGELSRLSTELMFVYSELLRVLVSLFD